MISEFSIFVPWKAALGIEPPESSVPAAICSTAAVEVFLPGKCPDIARFSTRELCNKAVPGGPHASAHPGLEIMDRELELHQVQRKPVLDSETRLCSSSPSDSGVAGRHLQPYSNIRDDFPQWP
jgi:hypothetical protein